MKIRINVNLANQIKLSHMTFDKAWNKHSKRMKKLLHLMNIEINDVSKFERDSIKRLKLEIEERLRVDVKIQEVNNSIFGLEGLNVSIENYRKYELRKNELDEERIQEIKNAIKEFDKKTKISTNAKREYWGYVEQFKQEEMKKHPRKYKTRMVEQK